MARKRYKKKASISKYFVLGILGVLAFMAVACGFFYANDRSKKDVVEGPSIVSSAPKVVNLVEEAIQAHRVLDNIILKKDNWQLIEGDRKDKELEVSGSTAKVKINTRALNIGVPYSTNLGGAATWVKERAEAAGLSFISGEKCNYKQWDGYRIELGISTKAGDSKKTFVTDTIVFYHNGNLVKEDKDVKDKAPDKERIGGRKYKGGKLAVIIDDCGYDISTVKGLLDTNLPFSYAILPYKAYSGQALELIKSKGRVAMLHLPMEPLNSKSSEGANAILVNLTEAKKVELARKAMNSLPGIKGVNNHQGSKATSDPATMKTVLREIKSKGLFFVDSRTTANSVARDTAKNMGVRTARNDIFLDNSTDIEDIREQIYKAMSMAEKSGGAIAICHARPGTVKCWTTYLKEFKAAGIQFVPITDLLY